MRFIISGKGTLTMPQDEQTTDKVLAEFFSRLRANSSMDKRCIVALEGLVKGEKLHDAAAIQAALRDSLGKDHATS
jgi:hypothetical protein